MKKVDYANIALGMESSPSFGKHIQSGMIERFAAVLKALTNDSNQVVKIYGCVMTVVGTQYDQTAGAVYYQGEIYSVDVFSGNHASQIPVYNFVDAVDAQAWYGDVVTRNTFFTKKLNLQLAVSGSGLANYNAAVLFQDKLSDFVQLQAKINASIAALVNSSPAALDTLQELAAALGNDANFATTVTNALAVKAPLASPVLTGVPTAPTAAPGTNTTQIATTAFLQSAINALLNSAPGTLDTLQELAAALGNDPNFATTIASLIGAKVAKVGDSMSGALVSISTFEAQGGIRTKNSGPYIKCDIVQIGDWNMDSTLGVSVAIAIDFTKIRSAVVIIRNDNDDIYRPLDCIISGTSTPGGGIINMFSGTIQLERVAGGIFDNAFHDSTSYNRGWIKLLYEA